MSRNYAVRTGFLGGHAKTFTRSTTSEPFQHIHLTPAPAGEAATYTKQQRKLDADKDILADADNPCKGLPC